MQDLLNRNGTPPFNLMNRFYHVYILMIAVTLSFYSTAANGHPLQTPQSADPQQQDTSEPTPPSANPKAHPSAELKLTDTERQRVLKFQQQRIEAIERVIDSVVAIYGEDRGGGGSGVVITPTGLALTNHHVINGVGMEGWGGMAGNKLYRWKLIGTDPGGDVSLIQMIPGDGSGNTDDRDDNTDGHPTGHAAVVGDREKNLGQSSFSFPFTPLGDSDEVEIGDWALAMGNPFILSEDQSPTVTMGIVSGVNRYQSGAGANRLIYGNCIQIDSSINPGNSGGPLFNLSGKIIGINGRGSFRDRGRVNVGLGYAISANQIKNFIPELLATKLVEHGTLDANFSDRGGKVVCSRLSIDSPAAQAGLGLGDQLVEFEGESIQSANQFTNLLCTLPQGWPARLTIQKPDGDQLNLRVRLLGLPYPRPDRPAKAGHKKENPGDPSMPPTEEQKSQQRKLSIAKLLSAKPGSVLNADVNQRYAAEIIRQYQRPFKQLPKHRCWKLDDLITNQNASQSPQPMTTWICGDGRFWVRKGDLRWHFDGHNFFESSQSGDGVPATQTMSHLDAKLKLETLQAIALTAGLEDAALSVMGDVVIGGSGLSDKQLAIRLIADGDDGPLHLWIGGTIFSDNRLQILKCAADVDCRTGGIRLSDWQTVGNQADQSIDGVAFPMVRQSVQGISETVLQTISNAGISEISIDQFEALASGRATESVGSDGDQ